MPATAHCRGTRFALGATHAASKYDGGIKVPDMMALDKPSIPHPDLRVSGAPAYQCGHAVLEYRVICCGRKSRLDLSGGGNKSRPAADTDPCSRSSTPSEISISSNCRHAESGIGAALIVHNMNSPNYVKMIRQIFIDRKQINKKPAKDRIMYPSDFGSDLAGRAFQCCYV
jgi:hypothetical protein